MKEKEIEIYSKCIDMRKEAMLEREKKVLESDKKDYLFFKKYQLVQAKKEYQFLLQKMNEEIESMYFRVHKTNQKYCKYHPIKQEELRSLRAFYNAQIEYIDLLIKKEERTWNTIHF